MVAVGRIHGAILRDNIGSGTGLRRTTRARGWPDSRAGSLQNPPTFLCEGAVGDRSGVAQCGVLRGESQDLSELAPALVSPSRLALPLISARRSCQPKQ